MLGIPLGISAVCWDKNKAPKAHREWMVKENGKSEGTRMRRKGRGMMKDVREHGEESGNLTARNVTLGKQQCADWKQSCCSSSQATCGSFP